MAEGAEFLALVDSATDRKLTEISDDVLKKIKNFAKNSEQHVKVAFEVLSERAKFPHAQVRLHVLHIMHSLFTRSRAFRKLTAESFPEFLQSMVGFDKDHPLPGPQDQSDQLRNRALEILEKWNEKYGTAHRQVQVGCNYLKEVHHFNLTEISERRARQDAERIAREERAKRILKEKYAKIVEREDEFYQECEAAVSQFGECLDIVKEELGNAKGHTGLEVDVGMQWEDVDQDDDSVDPNEFEDQQQLGLSNYAIDDLFEPGLDEQESRDPLELLDSALVENLRGLVKMVNVRMLPVLKEWMGVLVRVEVGEIGTFENSKRESILRRGIDLKNKLNDCKSRLAELNILEKNLLHQQRKGAIQKEVVRPSDVQSVIQAEQKATQTTKNQKSDKEGRKKGRRRIVRGLRTSRADDFDPAAPKEGMPYVIRETSKSPKYKSKAQCTRKSGGQKKEGKLEGSPSAKVTDQGPSGLRRSSGAPLPVLKALLSKAPRIDDPLLTQHWTEGGTPQPLSRSGMEVYNHWGRVDDQATMPNDKMMELAAYRASYYVPENQSQDQGAKKRVEVAGPSRHRQSQVELPTESVTPRNNMTEKERKRAIREEDRRHNAAVLGMAHTDEYMARDLQDSEQPAPKRRKKNKKLEEIKKFVFS